MKTHRAVAVLLLCSSAVVPKWAVAQDKDPVTETARRRFSEGVRFFDDKRFEEARAAFLQAYALKRHPAVLLNLAQSELRSNHPLDAARHFSAFLRESPTASPVERGEAERGLAAARTKLGRLQISVSASGAEVLIDNEPVGQSPLPEPVDVGPGAHAVEARLGRRSATASATVLVGKTVPVSLVVDAPLPLAGAGASAPNAKNAVGAPDAIAPRTTDETVEPAAAPDAATRDVSDRNESFFGWLGHSGIGLAGVGVTAIGLGLFAGFGLAGIKAAQNADSVAGKITEHGRESGSTRTNWCSSPVESVYEAPCATLRDNLDRRDMDRTVATVGIVAAGIGLTTTITAYLLSSPRTAEGPVTWIHPVLAPHAAGLSIRGSF
jgi:hypothetical protein